jgi:hypothetical protein
MYIQDICNYFKHGGRMRNVFHVFKSDVLQQSKIHHEWGNNTFVINFKNYEVNFNIVKNVKWVKPHIIDQNGELKVQF